MKKCVLMMAIVLLAITATFTFANADNLVPEIIVEQPADYQNDGYELHMNMYMSMPEYGAVIIKIAVNKDDSAVYGNVGGARAFDTDGNYIGDIGGSIVVDFSDCECQADMVEAVHNYICDYPYYSRDAEEGVTYEKIIIW